MTTFMTVCLSATVGYAASTVNPFCVLVAQGIAGIQGNPQLVFRMIQWVIMMAIIGLILVFKLLPKIGKFVPSSSIAGFLFVLGLFSTVVPDAPLALAENPAAGGAAMVVTAVTNPFLGMLAGVVVKLLGL